MAERKGKPYARGEFQRALVLNALLAPFNVLLLAAVLIAGLVLGVVGPLLPVAAVIYLAGAARTFFDEDVADRVLARERAARAVPAAPRVDPRSLPSPIARLLQAAHQRQARVEAAIGDSELPFDEVRGEVGAFVAAMENTARRAALLHGALAETPPDAVRLRHARVRDGQEPGGAALADALAHQLATLERMEGQLERFHGEMERLLVELDTVRASIVSASVSMERDQQSVLADEVRGLRERVTAVADGLESL